MTDSDWLPGAVAPVRLTDAVADAIRDRLCGVPPERGGALLRCGSLIHLLAEDTHGRYSGASWDISAELSTTVGRLEKAGHGRLAGTVHTHPYGIPDPSETDVRSTGLMLDINPHLSELVIAVVTEGAPRPHDVDLGFGFRMSLHVLRRDPGGRYELRRARGRTIPLAQDLGGADLDLPSATTVRAWIGKGGRRAAKRENLPSVINVNHRPRLVLPVPADRVAALLVDGDYPIVGPLAATWRPAAEGNAVMSPLPSPWDPTAAAGPQLAALARAAGGRRVPGGIDRVWPLVGDLADKRAVVAGLGSVGSRVAEDLVRCGVGSLVLIDPETVEGPNLARTVYAAADVGLPKPAALARRLRSIDPALKVVEHPHALGDVDLAAVLAGADLVVGATDDMSEQALLAHHAYAAEIPMVACALYRAAAAGEVVITVPVAGTACWNCMVGSAGQAYRPDRDYGLNGRLAGEAALGPAIHLVTSCASGTAVGLLAGRETPAGRHLVRLVAEGRTLGLVSTTPGWGFFPEVIKPDPHQHAPQSVWATVRRDPACPICGDPENRTAPEAPSQGEHFTDLLDQLRDETPAPGERVVSTEVAHEGTPAPDAAPAEGITPAGTAHEEPDAALDERAALMGAARGGRAEAQAGGLGEGAVVEKTE